MLVMPFFAVRPQSQYYDQVSVGKLTEFKPTYRLSARVAAFLTQCFLVQPGVVTVPGEEVARVVDGKGLVDVGGYEIVLEDISS